MTVYVRTPYNRFSQLMRHPRFSNDLQSIEDHVHIPVDVKEDSEQYTITAILPGLSPEDVEIEIKDKYIHLKGEFSSEEETEEENYYLRERAYGKFSRSFNLPDAMNAAKAEATMKNGVLTISIPKAEEAKPKTIKVIAK